MKRPANEQTDDNGKQFVTAQGHPQHQRTYKCVAGILWIRYLRIGNIGEIGEERNWASSNKLDLLRVEYVKSSPLILCPILSKWVSRYNRPIYY